MSFLDDSKQRVLLFDGAMGTLLLDKCGLKTGACIELLNLNRPMDILDAHSAYLQAGADILTANTFGASPLRLAQYENDLSLYMEEMIESGITLCREAASGQDRPVYIAASVGPSGLNYESDISQHARMYASFYAQCAAAEAAGADFILIETMLDLCEARLALLAARAAAQIPVLMSFSLERSGLTRVGSPPDVLSLCCSKLGASMIGVNCGYGPVELLPGFIAMAECNLLPVFAQPSAGLPETGVYSITPSSMAAAMEPYLLHGAKAIGGCCGTLPSHTQALASLLQVSNTSSAHPARLLPASICSLSTRAPLSVLNSYKPLELGGLSVPEAVVSIKQAAGQQQALSLDFAGFPPRDIPALLFTVLPLIPFTPLAFHIYTAAQAAGALFAYPGIAGVYVHGEAYGVLKAAARYGAEVIH